MARKCADCPAIVSTPRCKPCAAAHDHKRGSSTARGYGSAWQRLSKQVLERDCRICQIQLPGCTGYATTADHVVAKVNGGTDEMSNLQAACRFCNSSKGGRDASDS